MPDYSEKTVHNFYNSLKNLDLDMMMKCFSENAVVNFPGTNQSLGFYLGRTKIYRFFKRMISLVPDLRFEIVRMFACENLVCVEWGLSGNTRKGGLLIRSGVSVFEMEKDFIIAMNNYIASGLFV